MGLIVIFFVVMLIVVLNQSTKNKQGQKRPNSQGRPMQQRQPQQVQPMYRQQPRQQAQPVYRQQQRQPVYTQQPYNQPVQQRIQPTNEAYNILERAANNVREIQEEDEPTVTAAASLKAKMQPPKQVVMPSGDLMKKVEDLIVTGYSGNLSFKRDFVAEGMDMLARYEIR